MSLDERVVAMRAELPQLAGSIFMNHGATSPVPRSVVAAAAEGMAAGAGMALNRDLAVACREARAETKALAAGLLATDPANIALVPNTSTALSLVACAIPWREGDNVVTAPAENPANVVPWLNLRDLGVEVRFLPECEGDRVDLGPLPELLDERTRLVAFSLVQYATGQRLDLAQVSGLCRPRGIFVCVDGVQAVGAIPVDVRALGVSFLAAGAHKWMLGSNGTGILYVDPSEAERVRSPLLGESNLPNTTEWEESRTSGPPDLRVHAGAARFEAGPQSPANLFALRQALRNIGACGSDMREAIEGIAGRLRLLTDRLVDGLARLDGRVVSPRGEGEWSGLVSFEPRGCSARDVVRRLAEQKVFVVARKGRVRISPHYYNTPDEVDACVERLGEAMECLPTPPPGG